MHSKRMIVSNKSEFRCGLFLFVLSFICGVITLCPTIYWRDAPEFVDVVQTLGISHPAGSPAYILLAKLATFFPLGSLAVRVNLVSVLGFACTTLLFFLAARTLARIVLSPAGKKIPIWPLLLMTLNFALSPSLWLTASFAEVYTINSAFLAALILCLFWVVRAGDRRLLFVGAFLYGVAAGVHATVIFYLPAFLIFFFIYIKGPHRRTLIQWVSGFFLLGFSIYAYLPIRSLANPPFDWGNPETLRQFLIHITDRKTQANHFGYAQASPILLANIGRYIRHVLYEVGWFALLPFCLGFWELFRLQRNLWFILLLLYLGNLIFFLNWKTGDGFIPSNLVLSLFSTVGLCRCFIWAGDFQMRQFAAVFRDVHWNRIFGFILLLVLLTKSFVPGIFSGLPAYHFADRSSFYNADETARSEYEKMPIDAMAVTTLFWFPFRYFQDIERYREDLHIIMASDVISPRYFNPVTQERFPNLNLPPDDPLQTPWYDYMPKLINLNITEREVFYEPSFTLLRPIHGNLATDLFLFRVIPGNRRETLPQKEIEIYRRRLEFLMQSQTQESAFDIDLNSREYYMTFLLFTGDYFLLHQELEESHQVLKLASNLRPDQGMVEFYLGLGELRGGEIESGRKRLLQVIRNDPTFPSPRFVLAANTLRYGDLVEASRFLSQTHKQKDLALQQALLWVEYHWRRGDLVQAREGLKRAREVSRFEEDDRELNLWENVLHDGR